jgi:Domain of unknown function (DUF427)
VPREATHPILFSCIIGNGRPEERPTAWIKIIDEDEADSEPKALHGRLVEEPRLVWEVPYFPTYYIPEKDLVAGLVPNGVTKRSPTRGDAELLDLKISGRWSKTPPLRYPRSPIEELRGLVRCSGSIPLSP